MKFIKLHESGREVLVNLDNVSEVYTLVNKGSELFFNFTAYNEQVSIVVNESLDEILELTKQVSQ